MFPYLNSREAIAWEKAWDQLKGIDRAEFIGLKGCFDH